MFARRARRLEVGQRGRKISLPGARFRSRPGERSVAKVVPGYLVEQRSDGLRVARPATKVVGEVTTRRVSGWRGDPYSRQQAGRPAEPAGRRPRVRPRRVVTVVLRIALDGLPHQPDPVGTPVSAGVFQFRAYRR